MLGSVTSWVTTTALGHAVSITGTQFSGSALVNGWFTFIGGITLLVLGGLLVVSDEGAVRVLGILFAVASLGLAVYDLVKILHLISKTHSPASAASSVGSTAVLTGRLSVGFGLIMVLVAAAGAVLASLAARR
jgi:hypothetical protein